MGEPVIDARSLGSVNYAARVASAAAGEEIVVSRLVHDLVASSGEFAFGEARQVELRGFAGVQVLYPLEVA